MHPHTQWLMQSTCKQTSVHIMTCTINTLPWITNMRASVKEQRWPLTFFYVVCIVHTVSEFTHLTNTLSAPSGVTNVAGANAYAAKFAASPAPTVEQNNKNVCYLILSFGDVRANTLHYFNSSNSQDSMHYYTDFSLHLWVSDCYPYWPHSDFAWTIWKQRPNVHDK